MRGRTVLVLTMTAFLIFAVLTLASLQTTYGDMQEEAEALREKCSFYDEQIAHTKSDLECDRDAAFYERIARERLGYCYPNEKLMYYYLND